MNATSEAPDGGPSAAELWKLLQEERAQREAQARAMAQQARKVAELEAAISLRRRRRRGEARSRRIAFLPFARLLPLALSFLLALAPFGSVSLAASGFDSWSPVAPMPSPRDNLEAVTGTDGRIYAIGGSGNSGATLNTVEAYTPSANTWACSTGDTSPGCSSTSIAPMPTARTQFTAAAGPDGKIYAIAGCCNGTGGTDVGSSVEAYDPSTNSWACSVGDVSAGCSSATIAPLPTRRFVLAAATAPNGRIYTIGGLATTRLNVVEAYDPSTNTWSCSVGDTASGCSSTTIAPLPTARAGLQAVTGPDGKIYVIGGLTGSNSGTATNLVEVYDPASNTWTTTSPMPTIISAFASATGPDGKIYVIGGDSSTGSAYPTTPETYSPSTNTWGAAAPMPTGRAALAAATGPDGKIYAIGGGNNVSSPLNTVEAYTGPSPFVAAGDPALKGLLFGATDPGSGLNAGVYGSGSNGNNLGGIGVEGVGDTNAGVEGQSASGYGGSFSGGKAPLLLSPASSTGAPGGSCDAGALYTDSSGTDYACVNSSGGTAWKQLATTDQLPPGVHLLTPTRVLDTRNNTGGYSGAQSVGKTLTLTLAGTNGIPSNATGIIGTLRAYAPSGDGYLTAYPGSGSPPVTSNVNFNNGLTVADQVTVGLTNGQMSIYVGGPSTSSTQVVLDISGYIH